MIRARFYINKEACGNDYRPVKWPIKYPYWLSGENDNNFILVAYADDEDQLKELWPEIDIISFADEVDKVEFSDRFRKPDWYEDKTVPYDQLYTVTLTKEQLMLVANCVEDISRFAAGQMELDHTIRTLLGDLDDQMDRHNVILDHMKAIKKELHPDLGDSTSVGYDGGEKKGNRKRLVGNTYQIYREILHQLTVDQGIDNVYASPTLFSGDMGRIRVKRIESPQKTISNDKRDVMAEMGLDEHDYEILEEMCEAYRENGFRDLMDDIRHKKRRVVFGLRGNTLYFVNGRIATKEEYENSKKNDYDNGI